MKITTETTIRGEETILEDTMNVSYRVEVVRENHEAKLRLRLLINNYWTLIDTVFGYKGETFEENLNVALEQAKENWNIEVDAPDIDSAFDDSFLEDTENKINEFKKDLRQFYELD